MLELFHDTQRQLLVYRADHMRLGQIARAIPEAKAINGSHIAVPHTLQNAQTLRWLNYPVAPIITGLNYDWPIIKGRKPLAHQKLIANFLVMHPRSFCLSDMGTMKSISALWAADWLMKQNPGWRTLIVAPLSTLERVWANEIFSNFLSCRSFEILHGDAGKRVASLSKPADFYILNYDGVGIGAHTHKRFDLDGFSKELAHRDDIRIIVCDEASAYKDSQTKRHRLARLVIQKRPYLWFLTGTPTPNAPTDAYGLAKLVNGAFGKSFSTFRSETMVKITNFKWAPQKDGYEKARRLLSPSIRFDIKDVWDGPEMTTQQRQVELSAEQKQLMQRLKRDLTVTLKSGKPITAVNEAAARQKFIQLSLGAIYDEGHKAHFIDAAPRMNELLEVLEQAPGKCLLFAPLTSVVQLLHKTLKSRWSCEMVYGDVSQKDRSRIFQSFQEAEHPRIIVADPGTMAHGLNLYEARTVIWYGTTDKPELYQQACKRAHRPGQKYPVTVVQLVSNAVEREIYRRLENNTSMQGMLLDMVRRGEL